MSNAWDGIRLETYVEKLLLEGKSLAHKDFETLINLFGKTRIEEIIKSKKDTIGTELDLNQSGMTKTLEMES